MNEPVQANNSSGRVCQPPCIKDATELGETWLMERHMWRFCLNGRANVWAPLVYPTASQVTPLKPPALAVVLPGPDGLRCAQTRIVTSCWGYPFWSDARVNFDALLPVSEHISNGTSDSPLACRLSTHAMKLFSSSFHSWRSRAWHLRYCVHCGLYGIVPTPLAQKGVDSVEAVGPPPFGVQSAQCVAPPGVPPLQQLATPSTRLPLRQSGNVPRPAPPRCGNRRVPGWSAGLPANTLCSRCAPPHPGKALGLLRTLRGWNGAGGKEEGRGGRPSARPRLA